MSVHITAGKILRIPSSVRSSHNAIKVREKPGDGERILVALLIKNDDGDEREVKSTVH